MMDQICELARSRFIDCTQRFECSAALGLPAARLDCEFNYLLVDGADPRRPEAEELAQIRDWLLADPVLPDLLFPRQILSFFTSAEEDLIEQHARHVIRDVYTCVEPILYASFAEVVQQLAAAGLLSPERLPEILSCKVVD